MKGGQGRAGVLRDLFLLFLLTAALIRPLFRGGYFENWGSIESTFIADARFLIAHWPHPQWQPLWYNGTRFDYVYPPALRYGTAVLAKVFGYEPVRAYHIYTAVLYSAGIAGVYLLVWVGMRSRAAAWLTAGATAVMSPSFLILSPFRHDSPYWAPQRLHVLLQYGEGPHMAALALIPFALAFAWQALEKRRGSDIALAFFFSAAVVAHNFYGAVALAIFYSILVWSFWITRRDNRIWAPAIFIPVLAYGMSAFWLVPSYFGITMRNMKYVSQGGNWWSPVLALAVMGAFGVATYRVARGRAQWTWPVFIAGAVLFFSLVVLGFYLFGLLITGYPRRLVTELDLVYVLAGGTVLLWLWNRPGKSGKWATAVVILGAFGLSQNYVSHAWRIYPRAPDYRSRVEYRIQDWIARNLPDARVQTAGSVRFWYDTWHDLAQLGGGSDQGILHPIAQDAQWELNTGAMPEPSVLWFQSFGVDAVYVSDQRSQEIYKDVQHPAKYADTLQVLYDDGQGNVIYRVPRRYPARARVVGTAGLNALRTPHDNLDLEALRAYVNVVERGPNAPASLQHEGPDAMVIRARLAPGQSVLVQESYDPAWQAWAGGRSLATYKDVLGFLVVDAPTGDQEIRLQFVTPLEYRVGRVVTALTVVIFFGLWFWKRTRGREGRSA